MSDQPVTDAVALPRRLAPALFRAAAFLESSGVGTVRTPDLAGRGR
jgi:hypothetical protein